MKKEIWKDIPGYEGFYQASNYGRIRSLDREVRGKYENIALKKGKILTPHKTIVCGKERWEVKLSKNGKQFYFVWARCIYSAFYGPIPEGMQVNHIDEDPSNNKLGNLNLMTPKENSNWGTGIARRAKTTSAALKGKQLYSENPNAKPILEYTLSGEFIKEWDCVKSAAEHYNAHYSSLWLCATGRTKFSRKTKSVWKFAS